MKNNYDLRTLLVEVTQKCNAACDRCGSRCDPGGKEFLSKEQILAAFRDIKENLGTDVMLNISGGEPLMRSDLFEMMSEATKMGFDWGMVSNGALIDDNVIQKMKSSGLKTLTISIDGLEETHNSLRHLKNGFSKIITAIKKLKAEDFLEHLRVTFTANRRNVFEFERLFKILNPLGLDSIRVGLMDPIGRATEFSNLLLNREEIIYFTDLTNRLNAEKGNTPIVWGCPHFMGNLIDSRGFRCFAGKYAASILFNGDIFVCPNVRARDKFVRGNILKDSFSEVWKNGFRFFRNRQLPEKCISCEYKERCKGDSLHTFDFENEKPIFCYKEKFRQKTVSEYIKALKEATPELKIEEISLDKHSETLIIESEAYDSIKAYFHVGKKSPLSMFERRMALVGFDIDGASVVRYVIPCDGKLRASDNAIFSPGILKKVSSEVKIINKNYFSSDDRSLPGMTDPKNPMKFLGFIHSHPIRDELRYSVGDEIIHKSIENKNQKYFGVLIKPSTSEIGAYGGKPISQIRLLIASRP